MTALIFCVEARRGIAGNTRPPKGGRYEVNARLGEGEAAARGGDGAAEFFGGFEPFLDVDFYVGESFLVGLSVGGAARKFGDVVVGVAGGPSE
jgi:hypothetical protein